VPEGRVTAKIKIFRYFFENLDALKKEIPSYNYAGGNFLNKSFSPFPILCLEETQTFGIVFPLNIHISELIIRRIH